MRIFSFEDFFCCERAVDFRLKRSRSQKKTHGIEKFGAKPPWFGNSETAPELSKEEEA